MLNMFPKSASYTSEAESERVKLSLNQWEQTEAGKESQF